MRAGHRAVAHWSFIWPCWSALCSDSCAVVRALRSSRARRGIWLCQPTLGTPRKETVIFGESWQASPAAWTALCHPSDSHERLLESSSLESTPASLHPCSPGRPAQHTSAPVQSCWGGPWASAIPHPLQTLLLNDYSSCKSKRTQLCAFHVGGARSVCPADK